MQPSPSPLSNRTRQVYEDVARWVVQRHREHGLRVLGINGAQGSGKSTLAAFLAEHLTAYHPLNAVALSLDDFYLSRAARAKLAIDVHPLLATRGVPGTHDAARGLECLQQLRAGTPCRLPAFSKATDDVLDARHERQVTQRPDLILLEGWCVGTPPQNDAELTEPVNELERIEDSEGIWRAYVNQQLAGPYAQWFGLLDGLLFLQVPGWQQIRQWRAKQERETAVQYNGRSALSDPAALDRFLQHYQRLTGHALAVMPSRADLVLRLDSQHEVHLP